MEGLPKQRSAVVDQNVQLLFKITAFINIQFLTTLDPKKRLAYLKYMYNQDGKTIDKLESIFWLKPSLPVKNLLHQFLKANETDLERDDLILPFNQMLQKSIINVKRIDI